jgi:hypothetical protein
MCTFCKSSQTSTGQNLRQNTKKIVEAESEFKKVPLDPRVLDKTVCIVMEASKEE